MFAVVDVETTGSYASGHGMTEIAIVVHNGMEVVQEYSTLLNPKQNIPLSIQTLTGITPDMVADAPLFEEKANEILKVLGNNVFVAHNVNFDYAFVKAAFETMGVDYNPKRLCSVRYARRIEKGLRSYSLRNLCKHFKVDNEAAHRAWGDARATAQILQILLKKDTTGQWQHLIKKNSGEFNLPSHLPFEDYNKLPQLPGVYYFLDQSGKPIYIGKAKNLKKRVSTHFISGKESKRSQAFKREIYRINYELTGDELLASLLEDHEIRHYWPKYNSAQKNPKKRFGVFTYQNQKKDWVLGINKITSQQGYIAHFNSYNDALNWAFKRVEEYSLNPIHCGFPQGYLEGAEVEDHNLNFETMLAEINQQVESLIIKTKGRNQGEHGFAYIENGRVNGIGFVPKETEVKSANDILAFLREIKDSVTTKGIISKVIQGKQYPTMAL